MRVCDKDYAATQQAGNGNTRAAGSALSGVTAAVSPVGTASKIAGHTCGLSPHVLPRPAYGPFAPVLLSALLRTVRFGALCTAVALLTQPLYTSANGAWASWSASAAARVVGTTGAAWVTAADVWFGVGLSAAISTIYVLAHGAYAVLDLRAARGNPSPYLLPRALWMEPGAAVVRFALVKQAVAHLVTAPLLMLLVAGPLLRAAAAPADLAAPATLPRTPAMLAQFVTCFLVNELLFFAGHRLLHHPVLYARVHKQHHAFVGTRSFAAEHAHPVEQVLTAYVPFLLGLVLTGAHFHVVFVWFFCRLVQTYEAHSGYCWHGLGGTVQLPGGAELNVLSDVLGLTQPEATAFHDFHHTRNRGCFGWTLLDYLCGTMDTWLVEGGFEGYLACRDASMRQDTTKKKKKKKKKAL